MPKREQVKMHAEYRVVGGDLLALDENVESVREDLKTCRGYLETALKDFDRDASFLPQFMARMGRILCTLTGALGKVEHNLVLIGLRMAGEELPLRTK